MKKSSGQALPCSRLLKVFLRRLKSNPYRVLQNSPTTAPAGQNICKIPITPDLKLRRSEIYRENAFILRPDCAKKDIGQDKVFNLFRSSIYKFFSQKQQFKQESSIAALVVLQQWQVFPNRFQYSLR
ncbi:MAG: hypothetical protein GC192_19475 [Bacteroidetes bacterium]|nr:hypothetical protein [Bacteroidota bacterium]